MVITPNRINIIPISKLLGNYNRKGFEAFFEEIIPISKLLGNYNGVPVNTK